MQASYTDMIIIVSSSSDARSISKLTTLQNKWEHVSERQLDILIDHLNTLNDLTPKIKCEGRNGVDPALIFGLDSKLYMEKDELVLDTSHHDEVQTATVYAGSGLAHGHSHGGTDPGCTCSEGGHAAPSTTSATLVTEETLSATLGKLSTEAVWRVKGFVRTHGGVRILNWAFGRYDLTETTDAELLAEQETVKLTVMGERGEVKREARKLAEALGATIF